MSLKKPAVPPQSDTDKVGEFPIYYTFLVMQNHHHVHHTHLKTPAVPPQQLLSDDEVGEFHYLHIIHTHVCQRCRIITMYIILRYNLKTPAVPPQQLLSDNEVGEFHYLHIIHTHVCQRCRIITMYIILRY